MAPSNISSAKTWKKTAGFELMLPSGNVCLVKRPGMEKLLSLGILPDSLTPLAMEAVTKAQKGPQDHKKPGDNEIDPAVMEKFLEKEGAMEAIFTSFDRVTALCVIEPKVLWHMREAGLQGGVVRQHGEARPRYEEIPLEERDEDVLYTDDVDLDDKTFIFQFVVGGTHDLEEFRKEQSNDVADLQSSENVVVSPKRTSRSKK